MHHGCIVVDATTVRALTPGYIAWSYNPGMGRPYAAVGNLLPMQFSYQQRPASKGLPVDCSYIIEARDDRFVQRTLVNSLLWTKSQARSLVLYLFLYRSFYIFISRFLSRQLLSFPKTF